MLILASSDRSTTRYQIILTLWPGIIELCNSQSQRHKICINKIVGATITFWICWCTKAASAKSFMAIIKRNKREREKKRTKENINLMQTDKLRDTWNNN